MSRPVLRLCVHCGADMPLTARRHAVTCSARCRQARSRARRRAEALPVEMTSRARWVRRDERKRPRTVDGQMASSTDPSTWSDHAAAKRSAVGCGLGFVLAPGDGLVCVDLDDAIAADGRLQPWAAELVAGMQPTFTEVSASGRGLHVWGRHPGLRSGRRIRRRDGAKIEIYTDRRYIALGTRYEDAPAELADLTEAVARLL